MLIDNYYLHSFPCRLRRIKRVMIRYLFCSADVLIFAQKGKALVRCDRKKDVIFKFKFAEISRFDRA